MDCCIVGLKQRRLSKVGKSLYAELEVSKTATDREINLQYKKLALRFHPDKNPGDDTAVEKFKEINRIHKILTDEKKREIYDEFGSFGLFILEEYGEDEVAFYAMLSSPWFQCLAVITGCFCCFCCCFCCGCCCGRCCKDKPDEGQNSEIPNIHDLYQRSIEDGSNSKSTSQRLPVIVTQPQSSHRY